MSDFKKLFKRDRFYWVIMSVIMTLLVIYMLANEYGTEHKLFHLESYLEKSQELHEVWEFAPILRNPDGLCITWIPYEFLVYMALATVIVALIAQAVRLLTQETQNRAETLRTLPVKSRNIVTCHYLTGLLTAGIPLLMQIAIVRLHVLYVEKNTDFIFEDKEELWIYAGKAIIIFMLHYSLLILCRKVTNNVPGTIFTFVIVEIAHVLVGYSLNMSWSNWYIASLQNWVFWTIETVVWILLSYIANQKQDYARNGVYSFTIVHWVMMGTVFGIVYFIFYGGFEDLHQFEDIPKAVSFLLAIAASIPVTAGVHFITKPKKI